MSLVRLQIDQWLIAAREFLTKQEIDNINSVLKTRKIRLTHSTFLHYTNEFALLLEKRGNKSAWETVSKITSYFISYHMPSVSNKRPIIMNHFHIPNYDSLVPAFDSLKISVPDVLSNQATASSKVDVSKASTSDVDSNRKDDVAKSGILFPIVCKLRRCLVCKEFRETLVVCQSDTCKRKHRGGVHYLTHAQRRKLSRLHKFRKDEQQQNPENGQTSGEFDSSAPVSATVGLDTGDSFHANEPARSRDIAEDKMVPPRKRRILSWVEEVELEQP